MQDLMFCTKSKIAHSIVYENISFFSTKEEAWFSNLNLSTFRNIQDRIEVSPISVTVNSEFLRLYYCWILDPIASEKL